MKNIIRDTPLLIGTALLAACVNSADAPDTAIPSAIPVAESAVEADPGEAASAASNSIGPGMGRIVVYRASAWGLANNLMSPKVRIDGQVAGACKLDNVVQRDVSPGRHEASVQTDIIAKESFALAAGQTVYLKCNVLPIGLLLPAPKIEIVPAGKVPADVKAMLAE